MYFTKTGFLQKSALQCRCSTPVKTLEKYLRTSLFHQSHIFLLLLCPPGKSFTQVNHLSPKQYNFQSFPLSLTSRHGNNSLLCIFSLILNRSQKNQKNLIIKGSQYSKNCSKHMCAELPQSPISKSIPFFCCPSVCQRISQPPDQNQQNDKQKVSITTLVLRD